MQITFLKVRALLPTLQKWKQYYEQVCANKLDNLDEMDKFLDTHKLLKVTPKEAEILNGSVRSNELESIIQRPPNREKYWAWGFITEFYQEFILKLLHRLRREHITHPVRPALP